jgi:hypothetical protein
MSSLPVFLNVTQDAAMAVNGVTDYAISFLVVTTHIPGSVISIFFFVLEYQVDVLAAAGYIVRSEWFEFKAGLLLQTNILPVAATDL